jgi:hypothetical protein
MDQQTPDQMFERVDRLDPAGRPEDGSTPQTRRFASRFMNSILELRGSDPALWASGTYVLGQTGSVQSGDNGQLHVVPAQEDLRIQPAPEVTRAYRLLALRSPHLQLQVTEDGDVTHAPVAPHGQIAPGEARPQRLLLTDPRLTPEDRRLIVEARVAAMARVGVSEADRRILRSDEAALLLGRTAGMPPADLQRALRRAADRAEELFGRRYARAAYLDALQFAGMRGDALDRARGSAPAEASRRMAIARLDQEEALWRTGMPRGDASQFPGAFGGVPGMSTPRIGPEPPAPRGWFESAPVPPPPMGWQQWQQSAGGVPQTRATGAPGVTAQTWPKPTPEDIQDLASDPRTFQQRFDAEFGPGAAAQYLGMMRQGR